MHRRLVKSSMRLIASLLIPCLLVDPSLAVSLSEQTAGCDATFTREALTLPIRQVHFALSHGTFRQIRFATALLMAVLAAGGWNTVLGRTHEKAQNPPAAEDTLFQKDSFRKLSEDLKELPPNLLAQFKADLLRPLSPKEVEGLDLADLQTSGEILLPFMGKAIQPL